MQGIQSIREKFPQYSDLSDAELAIGFHGKFYSDMPIIGFAKKIGLDKSQSLDLLKLANQKGKGLKFEAPDANTGGTVGGVARGALQGLTFGAGDEIVAGGTTLARKAADVVRGGDASLSDIYQGELERERGRLSQFREDAPKTALASEIVGGVVAPLGAAKTIKGAAALGGGIGGTTGFLSSDGDMGDRLKSGAISAGLGAALGSGMQFGANKLAQRVEKYLTEKAMKEAAKSAPDVGSIKRDAQAAYKVMESSGVEISKDAYDAFVAKIVDGAMQGRDTAARRALLPGTSTVLDQAKKMSADAIGFSDLEDLRKLAQIPAGKVTDQAEQSAAVSIIKGIDEFTEGLTKADVRGGKSPEEAIAALKGAREMWGRMRRSEKIQNVIDKSRDYAGGFESGLKNQLGTILRSDKLKRGFSKDEIALMRDIRNPGPLGSILAGISYLGISTSGGRMAPAAGGMMTGAAAGGLAGNAFGPVGAAVGALAGAGTELALTTGLRAVREMSMEKRINMYQSIIASGKAGEVMQKAPEAFRLLQEAAAATTRGGLQAQ